MIFHIVIKNWNYIHLMMVIKGTTTMKIYFQQNILQLNKLITWIVIIFTILVPFLISFFMKQQYHKPIRSVGTITFSLYVIYAMTLLERVDTRVPECNFDLFWTWEKAMKGSWLHQYFIVGNIVLFVPLGMSVTAALPANKRKCWFLALVGLTVSGIVEGIQYFRHLGLCELDDLVHNTLGMLIGYGIMRLCIALRDIISH